MHSVHKNWKAWRIGPWPILLSGLAWATIFAHVRGIVHDSQHRPIAGAQVTVQCASSQWKTSTRTNERGEFDFPLVPIGSCEVSAAAKGFNPAHESVTPESGEAPILHLFLPLAGPNQVVTVSGAAPLVNTQSSTTQTMVSRAQIAQTPGAFKTNSMAMITDFTPGAYVVHDQLHVRGGHQVSWEVDGVPVPNTSIASNVGPQFAPSDIEEMEIQRGGYTANFGDRTYAVLNVVPRSGFERNREAELTASYGSFHQTDDDFSFGSHNERLAWYASVNGNRSDLGLETPTPAVLHDMANGVGGFASLIFNSTPHDQLRWITSLRRDFYQVPNPPDQEVAGTRDANRERDILATFSWLHTWENGAVLNISPFYHFNGADYIGGPNDQPVTPHENRSSGYLGGQISLSVLHGPHNAKTGFYTFTQSDRTLFGLIAHDGSGLSLEQQQGTLGNIEAAFVQDQYRVTPWLTLNAGLRTTRFAGRVHEEALNPRLGVALQLPRLHWVARAFYGRTYQPPPLETLSGPLLDFAVQQGFGFFPLHGERDEMHEFGLTIPWRGWVLDTDVFHTAARNFFDHDVIGNSNIFLPLTIARARIHGWETTLRSPQLWQRLQVHGVYSHQYAEGFGAVSGGLTAFAPPENSYYFLDHDQRNTLAAGVLATLPHRAWANLTVNYGSGFLQANGPGHLPSHTTADLAFGRPVHDHWQLGVQVLNLWNHRYLLDTSNTFGGTHYAEPRELLLQVKYRFHY